MAGVAVGHVWASASRHSRTAGRCFLFTFVVGALLIATVVALRHVLPGAIPYPNEVVRQMGPGIFFSRLGLLGVLAGIGFVWCRYRQGRFSVLRQFGRTSLLVYWVHIELCYGSVVYSLRNKQTLPTALFLFALLTMAMLALSLAKTRLAPLARGWLESRFGSARSA